VTTEEPSMDPATASMVWRLSVGQPCSASLAGLLTLGQRAITLVVAAGHCNPYRRPTKRAAHEQVGVLRKSLERRRRSGGIGRRAGFKKHSVRFPTSKTASIASHLGTVRFGLHGKRTSIGRAVV
jgi:hypothetical protein